MASSDPRDGRVLLGQGNFLAPAESRAVAAAVRERSWWQPSEVGEAGQSTVDRSHCRSVWCWLPEPQRRMVLRRLVTVARAAAGATPRLQEPLVLRYRRGDYFRRHRDEYSERHGAHRRMSMIAFLTGANERDGFRGGELRFHVDAADGPLSVRVPGRLGTFVTFAAELEHEVLPVLSGERLTLVTWLY